MPELGFGKQTIFVSRLHKTGIMIHERIRNRAFLISAYYVNTRENWAKHILAHFFFQFRHFNAACYTSTAERKREHFYHRCNVKASLFHDRYWRRATPQHQERFAVSFFLLQFLPMLFFFRIKGRGCAFMCRCVRPSVCVCVSFVSLFPFVLDFVRF